MIGPARETGRRRTSASRSTRCAAWSAPAPGRARRRASSRRSTGVPANELYRAPHGARSARGRPAPGRHGRGRDGRALARSATAGSVSSVALRSRERRCVVAAATARCRPRRPQSTRSCPARPRIAGERPADDRDRRDVDGDGPARSSVVGSRRSRSDHASGQSRTPLPADAAACRGWLAVATPRRHRSPTAPDRTQRCMLQHGGGGGGQRR